MIIEVELFTPNICEINHGNISCTLVIEFKSIRSFLNSNLSCFTIELPLIFISNQLVQLMDFEEEHNDYTFDHLTIIEIVSLSPDVIPCAATDPYTKQIYVVSMADGDCTCLSF